MYIKNKLNLKIILIFVLIFPIFSVANERTDSKLVGDEFYKSGSFSKAVEHYITAYNLDSSLTHDFELNFKLARAYYESGNYTASIEHFRRALTLDSSLSDYILFFIANSYLKMDSLNLAEEYFTSLINSDPTSAIINSVKFSLAEVLSKKKQFDKANSIFLELAEVYNYKTLELYLKIAKNYEQAGNNESAYRYYFKIIEIAPERWEAKDANYYLNFVKRELTPEENFLRANVFLKHKQYKSALNIYKSFLKKYPNHETLNLIQGQEALFRIAEIYFYEGNLFVAETQCNEFIKKYSSNKFAQDAQIMLARIEIRRGRLMEAVEKYLKYVEKYPDGEIADECLWKSAWLCEESKKFNKAIEIYAKLYNSYKNSKYRDTAKWRIGFVYYKSQNYDEAIKSFEKLAENSSDIDMVSMAKFWKGKSLEKLKEHSKAKEIFQELAQLKWKNYYTSICYFWLYDENRVKQNLVRSQDTIPESVLKYYEREIKIFKLLGYEYAINELEAHQRRDKTRSNLLELRKVYEAVEAFGRAYRLSIFIPRVSEDDYNYLYFSYPAYYKQIVEKFTKDINLPVELIMALIRKESSFEREAVSVVGALGLMQLMPSTAKSLARKLKEDDFSNGDLFEPERNIKFGINYFMELLKEFNGHVELALAAYNAGPNAVKKWLMKYPIGDMEEFVENIEYAETRNYVRNIMNSYRIYQILYSDNER